MPIAELFDGTRLEFPEDTDPAVIQSTVKRLTLERQPKQKEGLLSNLQRGAESTYGDIRTGFAGLLNPTEAAKTGIEREEEMRQRLGPQESRLSKVEKAYADKGLLSAIGTGLGEIPGAITEQVPQLVTAFGGARTGAMFGAPAGPYGAAIGAGVGAFLPFFFQQYGGNIKQQAEVQKEKGEEVDVSGTKGAAFAVPMAGLDVAAAYIPFGKQIVGKMFGPSVEKLLNRGLTKEASEEAAKKLSQESFLPSIKNMDLGTIVKGTSKTSLLEMPTEITQQILGRMQSGQDLFSKEAMREYGETAFDVALLGPLGIYGRSVDKSAARQQILQAQQKAAETKVPQELLLLTHDPKVQGNTINVPIIVHPDGSTSFPSEANNFRENPVSEFTDQGLQQAYAPQQGTIVPPPPPPKPIRDTEVQNPEVMYGGSMGDVGTSPDAVQQAEQFKQMALEKQAQAQRTITSDTIKAFGIGNTANIYKDKDVIGADIGDPIQATIVKNKLLSIRDKHSNQKVKDSINEFLSKPEFSSERIGESSTVTTAPSAPKPIISPSKATPVGNEVWQFIQNRDRSTDASINQMNIIASNPQYDRASFSNSFTEGAPVVSGDMTIPENQLGRKGNIVTGDNQKIPVQYAVIDASQVIPSHNVNGSKNPDYVSPDYKGLRAITNGRVAGLQAGFARGTMDDYVTDLTHDDMHGISKDVIKSMKNPMLVRVMPSEMINKHTGDVSNTGAGLSLNVVEQAKNDINRINLEGIEFGENGEVTEKSVREFIRAMPQTEQNNLMTKDGTPSKQAYDRLNAAIFQQAYQNDKLTELAFLSPDDEIKNIVRALNMAAPSAIYLEGLEDYDVRPFVNEAVEMAINARRDSVSLSNLVKQSDMTTHPLSKDILEMFASNPRSARAVGENLNTLFNNAYKEATQSADMFGEAQKKPIYQVIKDSFTKKPEEDLFTPKAELKELSTEGITVPKGRHPQVVAAARERQAGRMSRAEYEKYVDKYMPISEVSEPRPPASLDKMKEVLKSNQLSKVNPDITSGTRVGLRMDINALQKGGSVVSIHEGGTAKTLGKTMGYSSTARVKNVNFTIRREADSIKVAAGEEYKMPQQTVEGEWVKSTPEKDFKDIQLLLKNPEWSQVSLDPLRHSYFYDRKSTNPVISADEVIQVGNFLLAKNVKFADKEDFLYSKSSVESNEKRKKELEDSSLVKNQSTRSVVYVNNNLALVKAMGKNGNPLYIPVKGDAFSKADIKELVDKKPGYLEKNGFSKDEVKELLDERDRIESKEEEKHKKQPFIKFKNNNEFSENVPKNLIPVIEGWRKLLGLQGNIYFTTMEDAIANKEKFTGPHRKIAYADFKGNEGGFTVPIGDNERVVAFKKSSSLSYMLETIAHEMGHIHEKQTFNNAPQEVRNALIAEWKNWAKTITGTTPGEDVINALRAKTSAQKTKIQPGVLAKNIPDIDSYWRSFGEWYADQTAKWAVSSDKPVSIVEKFFAKLGAALRKFYQTLKGQKYLPNETFKQYLDSQAEKLNLSPEPKIEPISTNAQQGFEFSKMSLDGVNPSAAKEIQSIFGPTQKITISEKFKELRPNFYNRIITGLFDEFRPIKNYSEEAHMKATLSKTTDGALEGLLMHGHVTLKDGALDIKQGTKGLLEILKPLGADVERYQVWKALSRDANLPENKRSFKDLSAQRDELLNGNIDGVPRKQIYQKVLNEENALNRSVLNVAKAQGIIDDEAYERFANDIYYIPFYEKMENGELTSVQDSAKLTGQFFSKALKGGEKEKMGDLMENTLRNWSHILSASMKNAAAVSTLDSAAKLGAATQVKSTYDGKDLLTVMKNGKKAYYAVTDPALVESISMISFLGPKSPFLDVAKGFTNALRFGVTLSPGYKIRNLIRDTISSAAISPVGMNVLDNVQRGLKLSNKGNPTYVSAMAGGGVFELGAAHEGNQAALVKRLIAKGVKPDTILSDAGQIKNILKDMYEKYNEFGNRFENANRLALYDKMIKDGKSHLEASYAARDLLNFTGQGSWRAVKTISQVVPFFNTRLQGLYKLGRDGISPTSRVLCNMATGKPIEESDKLKAQRFSIVSSAVALASVGLYMAYEDDEDFKKREDWDRDNFWWFKVDDVAYRIPKPFEIGALGTIAERSVEQIRDENVEGKVFYDRLRSVIMDTLSLNPTPQFVKPMIDLYANKDSFTGAPIESTGLERLSKQERVTNNTSELAKALGGVSEGAAKILTLNPEAQGFSPVQMDYALKAYLGWLGSTVATVSDKAVQPWSDVEKPGRPALDQYSMGFAKSLPETQSKYVTNFYNNSKRINEAFADMKRYAEQGEMEKVANIMAEKGDLIQLQGVYNQTITQMAEYRKYINIITNDKTMSKEDKENQITRMKVLISQLAENAETMRKSLKK